MSLLYSYAMDTHALIEISEESVLSSLEKWRRADPEAARIGFQIWMSFRTMMVKGEADTKSLTFLAAQCEDRRTRISYSAANRLFHLSNFVPERIAPYVVQLSQSKAAHARFAAIVALSSNLNSDLVTKLVRAGIKDRSSRVRWKAAQFAANAKLIHLRADLAEAIRLERDAGTKQEIEISHDILARLERGDPSERNFSFYKYKFTEPSVWS